MSHYIHGTGSEEQQRLTLLNTILLNDACLKELALQGGEKILDVGSGLGQFSRAMAKQTNTIVLGIERSEEQIVEAIKQAKLAGEERSIEFRQGDARQLPLSEHEWESFDVAFSRFVLEHVPDPLNIVQQMVRAVKKGGRVILADDDHDIFRLYPEIPGFKKLWRAYIKTFLSVGNDPDIGRKLVSLLYRAGLTPLRNTWIFFGSCSGDIHFPVYVDNLIGVIVGAKEQMLHQGLFKEEKFDSIIDSFRDWRHKPDAALWYAVSWAEGVK
jgi:ubiquinone/menaquinone biosynthesis C-methylase UbiE